MKKIGVVVLIFLLLGFCSCATTSQNTGGNPDWDGVYTGTVPGADSGINVEITLQKDGAYTVSYQYENTGDAVSYTGTFRWKDDNTVELDTDELPPYYAVGHRTLTQLDMAGEKINGEYADMYVLKKE